MEPPDPVTPVFAYAGDSIGEPSSVVFGYVALKLFGVWMAVDAVTYGSYAFARIVTAGARHLSDQTFVLLLPLTQAVVYGVLAVVLLKYARPWARQLFQIPGTMMPRPSADLLVALISIGVGLYLAGAAIGELATSVILLIIETRRGSGLPLTLDPLERLVPAAIRFAVGIFLFARPNWVVGQWQAKSRMP